MARLAIATRNIHKVDEIWAILEPLLPHVVRADVASALDLDAPSPVEDGVTFEDNALIKARALAASSGLPALADDSGIAVDVLGGSPGVFSARWAGSHGDDEANWRLLLDQLADVPDQHRGAAFVCAAALVLPDGREFVEVGRMPGALARAASGSGGFGYDPVFIAEGYSVTTAELSPDQKNAISHRGKAFRSMAPHLKATLQY